MRLAKWQLRLIGFACIVVLVTVAAYLMAGWNGLPTWVKVGSATALIFAGVSIRVIGRTIRHMR